jgi:5'-nucleotidase
VPKVQGEVGGASYFAAHLKRLGAGQPNTLIVAAGDLVGASPLTSSLFHHEPTVEVMNAMGLTATTVGNHEFDQGLDELLRLKNGGCHPKDGCKFEPTFGGAKYAELAANVTMTSTKASPLPAYVIREVAGIPIAFVGMPLTDTPHSVVSSGVAGLAFADEVATANALVPEIKQKGAQSIVLLIHQGGEVGQGGGLDDCVDFKGPIIKITEKLDPAYKVVVSGHTHALYNCTVAGRPVTSALSFGRVITTIDLSIDPKTREVVRAEAHNHAVTHDIAPDEAVQAIVDRAAAQAAPLENRPIGHITATLSAHERGPDSPLGEVIADAELEATKKNGAKIAIVNTSGVRTDIVFPKSGDEKEDGVVTYGEAFASQPFGNDLVTVTITGHDLQSLFEKWAKERTGVAVSDGLAVRYTEGGTFEIKVLGKPLDPKASLRITTNSFLADREPLLKDGRNKVTVRGDIDALEAYFTAHAKVSPPKTRRITLSSGAPPPAH